MKAVGSSDLKSGVGKSRLSPPFEGYRKHRLCAAYPLCAGRGVKEEGSVGYCRGNDIIFVSCYFRWHASSPYRGDPGSLMGGCQWSAGRQERTPMPLLKPEQTASDLPRTIHTLYPSNVLHDDAMVSSRRRSWSFADAHPCCYLPPHSMGFG